MQPLTKEERKERFFEAIREKKKVEAMLTVKRDAYYDNVIWEEDEEKENSALKEIEGLEKQIASFKPVIAELRSGFDKEELRELRREFYGETI
ncbi:hypothetical protein B4086_5786 [Bacillus cereus]|nr:hypothetical protein B4086_5786 [Bacillus cereus]